MNIALENQSDNSTVKLFPLKIIHGVVIGTNAASFLITIIWLPIIIRMLFRVYSNASPAKKIAFHLGLIFLCVMLGEAIHVVLRMFIYIVFLYLDFYGSLQKNCSSYFFQKLVGYNFITNLLPYQFIYIGLSHCILILRINLLILLFVYLTALYSNQNKQSFLLYEYLRIFVLPQALIVWVLLCVPWTAFFGSILFIAAAVTNGIFLAIHGRIFYATIKEKISSQIDQKSLDEYRRMIKLLKISAFTFLPSLYIYTLGVCVSHFAIWTVIGPCIFNQYYSFSFPSFTLHVFEFIERFAAAFWLFDYASIIQFDIILVIFNIIHLCFYFISTNKKQRRDSLLSLNTHEDDYPIHD